MTIEKLIDIVEKEIINTKTSIVQIIDCIYEEKDLQPAKFLLMSAIGEAISDNYEEKKMDSYNNNICEIELNRYLPSIVKFVKKIEGLQRLIKVLKED